MRQEPIRMQSARSARSSPSSQHACCLVNQRNLVAVLAVICCCCWPSSGGSSLLPGQAREPRMTSVVKITERINPSGPKPGWAGSSAAGEERMEDVYEMYEDYQGPVIGRFNAGLQRLMTTRKMRRLGATTATTGLATMTTTGSWLQGLADWWGGRSAVEEETSTTIGKKSAGELLSSSLAPKDIDPETENKLMEVLTSPLAVKSLISAYWASLAEKMIGSSDVARPGEPAVAATIEGKTEATKLKTANPSNPGIGAGSSRNKPEDDGFAKIREAQKEQAERRESLPSKANEPKPTPPPPADWSVRRFDENGYPLMPDPEMLKNLDCRPVVSFAACYDHCHTMVPKPVARSMTGILMPASAKLAKAMLTDPSYLLMMAGGRGDTKESQASEEQPSHATWNDNERMRYPPGRRALQFLSSGKPQALGSESEGASVSSIYDKMKSTWSPSDSSGSSPSSSVPKQPPPTGGLFRPSKGLAYGMKAHKSHRDQKIIEERTKRNRKDYDNDDDNNGVETHGHTSGWDEWSWSQVYKCITQVCVNDYLSRPLPGCLDSAGRLVLTDKDVRLPPGLSVPNPDSDLFNYFSTNRPSSLLGGPLYYQIARIIHDLRIKSILGRLIWSVSVIISLIVSPILFLTTCVPVALDIMKERQRNAPETERDESLVGWTMEQLETTLAFSSALATSIWTRGEFWAVEGSAHASRLATRARHNLVWISAEIKDGNLSSSLHRLAQSTQASLRALGTVIFGLSTSGIIESAGTYRPISQEVLAFDPPVRTSNRRLSAVSVVPPRPQVKPIQVSQDGRWGVCESPEIAGIEVEMQSHVSGKQDGGAQAIEQTVRSGLSPRRLMEKMKLKKGPPRDATSPDRRFGDGIRSPAASPSLTAPTGDMPLNSSSTSSSIGNVQSGAELLSDSRMRRMGGFQAMSPAHGGRAEAMDLFAGRGAVNRERPKETRGVVVENEAISPVIDVDRWMKGETATGGREDMSPSLFESRPSESRGSSPARPHRMSNSIFSPRRFWQSREKKRGFGGGLEIAEPTAAREHMAAKRVGVLDFDREYDKGDLLVMGEDFDESASDEPQRPPKESQVDGISGRRGMGGSPAANTRTTSLARRLKQKLTNSGGRS